MSQFSVKFASALGILLIALNACGVAPQTAPKDSPSASASSNLDERTNFDAFVKALDLSESGWVNYYAAQDTCLPLKHRRGNLAIFKGCIFDYTTAFSRVLALRAAYLKFLESYTPPTQSSKAFVTYRTAVARTDKRLSSMYEVFCVDEPHSTLDWYNCIGSSDVSEAWDRYSLIQDDENEALKELEATFHQLGFPKFNSQ